MDSKCGVVEFLLFWGLRCLLNPLMLMLFWFERPLKCKMAYRSSWVNGSHSVCCGRMVNGCPKLCDTRTNSPKQNKWLLFIHLRFVEYRHESDLTQQLMSVALRTSCILGEPPRVCSENSSSRLARLSDHNVAILLKFWGEEGRRTPLTLLIRRCAISSPLYTV